MTMAFISDMRWDDTGPIPALPASETTTRPIPFRHRRPDAEPPAEQERSFALVPHSTGEAPITLPLDAATAARTARIYTGRLVDVEPTAPPQREPGYRSRHRRPFDHDAITTRARQALLYTGIFAAGGIVEAFLIGVAW